MEVGLRIWKQGGPLRLAMSRELEGGGFLDLGEHRAQIKFSIISKFIVE